MTKSATLTFIPWWITVFHSPNGRKSILFFQKELNIIEPAQPSGNQCNRIRGSVWFLLLWETRIDMSQTHIINERVSGMLSKNTQEHINWFVHLSKNWWVTGVVTSGGPWLVYNSFSQSWPWLFPRNAGLLSDYKLAWLGRRGPRAFLWHAFNYPCNPE